MSIAYKVALRLIERFWDMDLDEQGTDNFEQLIMFAGAYDSTFVDIYPYKRDLILQ